MCVKPASLLLALFLFACSDPTEPDIEDLRPRGRLSGLMTIGPNCPPAQGVCPTQPSAYSLRKVLVYNEAKTTLLFTVDVDSRGLYFIDLLAGRYTIDLRGQPDDRTGDLPKTITISPNSVTLVNVSVDTGIR